MEGLRERINEIRDHYRLSNRGFAAALGTRPAATNNYLNGTKEPSLDFVNAILSKYVDISADWLMRGKGTMFYQDTPSIEVLTKELAETRVKLLVQEGVTERLSKILEGRVDNSQDFIKEKYQGNVG